MASRKLNFRTAFKFVKENANWYPGHMGKGVHQMQQSLKIVDCIIEVHDARIYIPFSGRNPNFYHLLTSARPHVLVLNKKDLIDLDKEQKIRELLRVKMNDTHVIFTRCNREGCEGVKQIMPMVIDLMNTTERIVRTENDRNVMVIGVPNVGKSSLINSLRTLHLKKGKAAAVGAIPGVTRSVMNRIKVSEQPLTYLLDTPGILQPNITNMAVAMKLALCDTIQDTVMNSINKADYLLFWLNKHNEFSYVDIFEMEEPCDDIYKILLHISTKQKLSKAIKNFNGDIVEHPDLDVAATRFLKSFQQGKLGTVILDSHIIDKSDDI